MDFWEEVKWISGVCAHTLFIGWFQAVKGKLHSSTEASPKKFKFS